MWKFVVAILLVAHGLGHWLGVLPVLGAAKQEDWSDDSPLLVGVMSARASHALAATLWLLAMAGFVGAGFGLLGILVPPRSVRILAAASAWLSLIALTLFWHAFPSLLNKLGAITVDLGILAAVLANPWPTLGF